MGGFLWCHVHVLQLEVFSGDLKLSSDVNTGLHSQGKFSLQDFVMIEFCHSVSFSMCRWAEGLLLYSACFLSSCVGAGPPPWTHLADDLCVCVLLSPQTAGVVVSLTGQDLFILDMHGNLVQKSQRDVVPGRRKSVATVDKHRNEIKPGDVVRLADGPHKVPSPSSVFSPSQAVVRPGPMNPEVRVCD